MVHDATCRVGFGGELIVEFLGGPLPSSGYIVRVNILPDKLFAWWRGNAKCSGHDVVYFSHELFLLRAKRGHYILLADMVGPEGVGEGTKDKGMFTKLGFEKRVEGPGKRRVGCFRENRLGYHAVCIEEVDDHVPLAAVTDEVPGEVRNEPVINREVRMLDHEFEIVV